MRKNAKKWIFLKLTHAVYLSNPPPPPHEFCRVWRPCVLVQTTLIDYVNERYAAGNVEIKNSITEAKHEILTYVAAVEQVADAAKLQADSNAI